MLDATRKSSAWCFWRHAGHLEKLVCSPADNIELHITLKYRRERTRVATRGNVDISTTRPRNSFPLILFWTADTDNKKSIWCLLTTSTLCETRALNAICPITHFKWQFPKQGFQCVKKRPHPTIFCTCKHEPVLVRWPPFGLHSPWCKLEHQKGARFEMPNTWRAPFAH